MNWRCSFHLDLPCQRDASRGFTLIELLIALTLMGLLSVALLGGLRFGTRVWETGHEHSQGFAEIEGVYRLLRRQLSQARLIGRGSVVRVSFVGNSDRVRFIAPLPDYVGVGGLYRFELALVENVDGAALELTWQLHRPDRSEWFDQETLDQETLDQETLSRRILIEGVDRIEIRYFGTFEAGGQAEWRDYWDSSILPSVVTLELKFPVDDARTWPKLTVVPHATKVLGS